MITLAMLSIIFDIFCFNESIFDIKLRTFCKLFLDVLYSIVYRVQFIFLFILIVIKVKPF